MSVSTTIWHRLEPRVRGTDPAIGLAAPVHDPLWLLGRQWQTGELLGEDAASPVAVRVETAESPLTRFAPPGGSVTPYDGAALPLEVLVEREPTVTPTLRLRLEAWARLRALLDDAGLGDRAPALAAAHPLPPPRVAEDLSDARLRLLAGAGVGDGSAVAATLAADPGGLPPSLVETFLAWHDAVTATGAGCWVDVRLEHRFRVGTDDGTVLSAPAYPGGGLEWYDVDVDVDADPDDTMGPPVGPADPAATRVAHLLPTRVRFPGMPAERFWELEDAAVDLGAISASTTDLGRLLTVEFATVFGVDWWTVPVPAHFGTLVTVTSLTVRDSFGDTTTIEPTEAAMADRATAPWHLFRLSTAPGPNPAEPEAAAPGLFLPPVLVGALEGDPVEEVRLLRDEMADLAWAVERVVEGADGRPRDRSVEYATRLTAAPLPDLPSPADLVYAAQTTVPDHWIPLVPVRDPEQRDVASAVVLQRSSLLTQDGSMRPITAQGTLLRPDVSLWYLHEEEVTRAGTRLRRIPCVARWLDGVPMAWTSRRAGSGRGEGASGLAFDLAVPPAGG